MGKYFGTDGVRGAANKDINPQLACAIGRFIGFYPNSHKNKILIARDTRISGAMISSAVISGIVGSGSDAFDLGVSTTPSISYLVRKNHFDYGVMISASHNPYYDNGIKVFNSDGEKLNESIELKIEDFIDADSATQDKMVPLVQNEHIGRVPPCSNYIDEYIEFLSSKASPFLTGLNVLIDCANGSASSLIKKLVHQLGINATIVNANPNGININDSCGSTHIGNLVNVVKHGQYDCAFAFDGDADRCLALTGSGKIVDGDAIMYISALKMKKDGVLCDNSVVFTVMSNLGLRQALKAHHINGVEVQVGDKYVQAELKQHHYSLGGEQSGHIIYLDDMNTGDGLLTMIKVMNIISEEKKSLDELVSDLTIYPQLLKNITVTNKEAVLSHEGFNKLLKEEEDKLGQNGRILVRASGTEPLIRVMCEAKTSEKCEQICHTLIDYINEIQQ